MIRFPILICSCIFMTFCLSSASLKEGIPLQPSQQFFNQLKQNGANMVDLMNNDVKQQLKNYENELTIFSDWDQALAAAPMSVSLIAQLILLSVERDFTLVNNRSLANTLLRYARFKPAMQQVSDELWESFSTAGKNTHAISMEMIQVSQNVRRSIDILFSKMDPDFLIDELLIPLQATQESTANCIKYTIENQKSFLNTMRLINELSQSLVATGSKNEEDLEAEKQKKKELDIEMKYNNKSIEETANNTAMLQTILKRNRADHDKYMAQIPVGWEAVGQAFLASLNPTVVFHDMAQVASQVIASRGVSPEIVTHHGADNMNENEPPVSKETIISDQTGFQCSGNIVVSLNALKEKVADESVKLSATNESGIQTNIEDFLNVLIEGGASQMNVLSSISESEVSKKVKNNVQDMIDIADKAITKLHLKTVKHVKKFVKTVFGKLDTVLSTATKMATFGTVKNGFSTLPNQQIQQQSDTSNSHYMPGTNARIKAGQTQQLLENNQKRLDVQLKQMHNLNEETSKIMVQLSKLNTLKIDGEGVLKVVAKAITQLTKLKKYWNTLLTFFQTLTSSVNIALNEGVKNFQKFSNTTIHLFKKFPEKKEAAIQVNKQNLLSMSQQINAVASSIRVITNAYGYISKKHIMPHITSQLNLFVIPKDELDTVREKLNIDTLKITKEITSFVTDKKKEYRYSLEKSMQEVQNVFAVTGKLTNQEQKDIYEGANMDLQKL